MSHGHDKGPWLFSNKPRTNHVAEKYLTKGDIVLSARSIDLEIAVSHSFAGSLHKFHPATENLFV